MLFLRRNYLFITYLIFSLVVSILAHREVLFNPFNFGRHWDWSFFSYLPMYEKYIQNFFYVINNNANGTYGAIGFSDFIVKLGLIGLARLLPDISLAIINKVTVFILFPLVSSAGIWKLTSLVFRKENESNITLTKLGIALFANSIYTFSLPYIYELHGGALNRMVSISIMPFIFATLYVLFKTRNPTPYLLIVSLLTLLLDVTNIFYVSLCVGLLIILKKSTLVEKLNRFVVFTISLLFINAYWLFALFIGQTIDILEISTQRRLPIDVLRNYSTPFKQLLLSTSTPHNLIETTFGDNWVIYIPSILLFTILFYCLKKISLRLNPPLLNLTFFAVFIYITTTLLASGTYSLGNLYLALYQLPFLGFIQNSVRFSTNVLLSLYFLVAIFISQTMDLKNKFLLFLFYGGTVLWIVFLVMNPGFIRMTYDKSSSNTPQNVRVVNNEIGALYEPDNSLMSVLENNKFLGNLLPIPSTISPYFEDNYYPRTSQGSDTEIEYEKPILQTYGIGTKYEEQLRKIHKKKDFRQLLEDYSVEYVWDTRNSVYTEKDHQYDHFTHKSLTAMLRSSPDLLLNDHPGIPTLYSTSPQYLKPIIRISSQKEIPETYLEIKKINETKYLGVIHNPPEFFSIELAKYYYPGWKLRFYSQPKFTNSSASLISTYKILPNNERTQATTLELRSMYDKKLVSTLGDGTQKILQYHTFENGVQRLSRAVPFKIGYISRPIRNTIQNENLSEKLWNDTTRIDAPDSSHTFTRSYTNTWKINREDIAYRTNYSLNDTRMYFTIEFDPQRTYEKALLFSIVFLIITSIVIFINIRKIRNEI